MTATASDLFSGLGGFTTAAEAAGLKVVWAANHWPQAVHYHKLNHPGTLHACQDLKQARWHEVPKHDVGLASPCCHGHSPARGKRRNNPEHDDSRSTAWAVVAAAEYHRQPLWVIENVPGFLNWELYPAFKMAMEMLGYSLAPHRVDVADLGVPQNRERLFIVCTRSKAPLWLDLPKEPHVGADTFIDFNAGRWSAVDKPGRSPNTLARVAAGRARFGERFLAPYYGTGSGKTGRDLARPIGTIVTRDRWSVIDGNRMRMLTKYENAAAMGFPASTILPENHKLAVHMLGNAVPPPAAQRIIEAAVAQA